MLLIAPPPAQSRRIKPTAPARFEFEIPYVRLVPISRCFLIRFNRSDVERGSRGASPLFTALMRLYERRLLSGPEVAEIFGAACGMVAGKGAK